ncbi:MAG TPA: TatD family hydrolase [Candidatus Saccharimonadales bacterium]
MIELFDTHCHIQESSVLGAGASDDEDETRRRWNKLGNPAPQQLILEAKGAGVTRLLAVGCTLEDSERAVALASAEENVWASIGIHPHDSSRYVGDAEALERFASLASKPKVVAVGECGLDYFYTHSPKEDQLQMLRFQLALAQRHDLPLVFHVREAFDDFWPVFDEFKGLRGIVHSFTADEEILAQILRRGLYVGLNGIMTFTKNDAQLAAAKAVPLDRLVLETDAPFLTPAPDRATICQPKHVRTTAEFLSKLRDESLEKLAEVTTQNAQAMFGLQQ